MQLCSMYIKFVRFRCKNQNEKAGEKKTKRNQIEAKVMHLLCVTIFVIAGQCVQHRFAEFKHVANIV